MKTKTIPSSVLILVSLLFLSSSFQAVNSQNNDSKPFTGSRLKSEDVVSKGDVIFVGQITSLGMPNPISTGVLEFIGTGIKVLQVLHGSINTQQVTVRFEILESAKEQLPTAGNSYIFFVEKAINPGSDPYIVLKLLPATDANIAKVKALIAAAPASK